MNKTEFALDIEKVLCIDHPGGAASEVAVGQCFNSAAQSNMVIGGCVMM
jgi:hypothetical protein